MSTKESTASRFDNDPYLSPDEKIDNDFYIIHHVRFPYFETLLIISTIVCIYFGIARIVCITGLIPCLWLWVDCFKHRKYSIRIDRTGICEKRNEGAVRYKWSDINRCYFDSDQLVIPCQHLFLNMKGGRYIKLSIDRYHFHPRKFAKAIDHYARRKIFGRTAKVKKEQTKIILRQGLKTILFTFIITGMKTKRATG